MTGVVITVFIFFLLVAGVGGVAYLTYHKKLRRAKAIERGLKMVPVLIHLPPPSSDTQSGSRDLREVMREKTSQAEVLYNLIAGTATEGFKSNFYGQRHIALELVVVGGIVHFFAAVPVALLGVIKQAITTAYPGARLEEVEDHNIFNQEGRLAATLGGEMVLRADSAYPIATYEQLERDPMEAILTAVSALQKTDGVAIQIMLRPAGQSWVKHSVTLADNLRKGKSSELKFSAMDLAKAAIKAPSERRDEERMRSGGVAEVSQLQLSQVERIEEKTKHPGFEVLIRVIVSTGSVMRSQQLLREISTAFALYENPGLNGFKFLPAIDVQGLVTAFIFRFFPNELKSNVLSSAELATLFHLPDAQFTPSTSVVRQQSKQVDGPVQLPATGLLFGYNEFRGAKKEIRLSPEDRRRHTYVLGQTGTGKSTMLENLAVQDMLAGNGFAFIDPHGDSAEKLLALIPKERAEDVIYFNPSDTQYPLGLNLFEFTDPAQKDFLVQETINMLYKLYDPGHTGIIGPRYEHWYRNAALTLMSDPNGSTFIEIPKVFTDTEYLKAKFKYLKDPTVIDFWTKEMGQTSDYHKSEMLGWFVSKFGAFQNNEMMRNIIGQTKSSFNIRDIMDKKKILIVNLSKGKIGELNSQLLGMIFVIKFQAAAMSRADVPEEQRSDFALYVDEFQNFSTDSFASILSEARKYRLNLIVANQFIGQLSNEIRDAVFGNIGTIVAHRMGPDDAEFMTKQFAPVFDAGDLVNIPNYQAAMRLMIGGLPSQPFTLSDSAPIGAPNAELGVAIKQLSAAKYGHNKAEVEADLVRRLTGQAVPGVPVADSTMPLGTPQPVAAVTPAAVAATPAPAATAPSPVVVEPAPAAVAAVAAPATVVAPPAAVGMPASEAEPAPLTAQPAGVALTSLALTPGPEPLAETAAAPAAAVEPPQSLAQLAATPPPIGAPPVDLAALMAEAAVEPPSAAQLEESAENVPQMQTDVSEQALAHTPPPIGAPPVDLPQPAAVKPVSVGTLSLDDITGRKKELVEEDPYAQIDVLGPAAPKVIKKTDQRPEPVEPLALETEMEPEPARDPMMEAAPTVEANEPLAAEPEMPELESEPEPNMEEEPEPRMEPEPAPREEKSEDETGENDSFMSGLPEGVHILEQPKEYVMAKPAEAAVPELPVPAPVVAEFVIPTPAEPTVAVSQPADVLPEPPAAPVIAQVSAPVSTQVSELPSTPEPSVMSVATTSAMPPAPEPAIEVPVIAPVAVVEPEKPADTPVGEVVAAGSEPAVPASPVTTPAPASAVEKAEQEIDDLLSVSLIHPDRNQPRLSNAPNEQAETVVKPDKSDKPATTPASGMRVIQPLGPIEGATPVEEKAATPVVDVAPAPVAEATPSVQAPEISIPEPAVLAPEPVPAPVPAPELLAPAPKPDETAPTIADIQYDPAKAAVPTPTPTQPDSQLPNAPMPGSAIMPQAMADRPVEVAAEKPSAKKVDAKSLAPGQVFVDENGNVIIGGI